MLRSMLPTAALVAMLAGALASPARADVHRFSTSGASAEPGDAASIALTVTGTFNPRSGKLRGHVRCARGCPLRGRLKASCEVGDGFYFVCGGSVHGKRCRVDGYLYQHGFAGTFVCGDRSGSWTFGSP